MDRRHERSSVHVGVADSSDEHGGRRNARDVFACHQRHAFQVIVNLNHQWTAGFAAEKPRALADDA